MVVLFKFVFDVYLYVVSLFGVVFECCLVVEDSSIGICVVFVVGMWVIGFVGVGYIFVGYVEVLCELGVIVIVEYMCELLEMVVCLCWIV